MFSFGSTRAIKERVKKCPILCVRVSSFRNVNFFLQISGMLDIHKGVDTINFHIVLLGKIKMQANHIQLCYAETLVSFSSQWP